MLDVDGRVTYLFFGAMCLLARLVSWLPRI